MVHPYLKDVLWSFDPNGTPLFCKMYYRLLLKWYTIIFRVYYGVFTKMVHYYLQNVLWSIDPNGTLLFAGCILAFWPKWKKEIARCIVGFWLEWYTFICRIYYGINDFDPNGTIKLPSVLWSFGPNGTSFEECIMERGYSPGRCGRWRCPCWSWQAPHSWNIGTNVGVIKSTSLSDSFSDSSKS